jgi:hypothetical protein
MGLRRLYRSRPPRQSAARTLEALRSGHGAADAGEHASCRLVAAAYLALQGACADACLLAGHEPYGHEPLPELEMGPFHHRACGDGELVRALGALPLVGMPVHLGAGAVSAHGADEASGMLLLEEPPLARLLVRISLQELQERAPALAFASCSGRLHGPSPSRPPIFRMHQPFIHMMQRSGDRNSCGYAGGPQPLWHIHELMSCPSIIREPEGWYRYSGLQQSTRRPTLPYRRGLPALEAGTHGQHSDA